MKENDLSNVESYHLSYFRQAVSTLIGPLQADKLYEKARQDALFQKRQGVELLSKFQWDDNHPQAQHGDGISHPAVKGAKTKFYKLLVRNQQMAAMKVELKAETQRDAVRYGKARWPDAAIEVVK